MYIAPYGRNFRGVQLSTVNTGWPKKVSHYQIIQKSYEIVLKPVNKIRFIHQIKVSIKHYNIIP